MEQPPFRDLRREQHLLVPTLKEGHVVVMDNLLQGSTHESLRVRELIEEAFSKVKAILGQIAEPAPAKP